ncbi:DgyrCDS2621 [Dimorphilus gyrociliatus]|uniref:DgyrCDS2621 n=1 Tax=Dimorphilus gyrociliatus TaxID=2664684 RepID=A0A7I8VAU4_9ANNE|nr:DgyrCDS2621 [Dimorphilus gyrociliatus]
MTESSKCLKVKKKFLDALHVTSMKSIPRIVKTRNSCIMSMWIVVTILVIGIACYHSHNLISGYLEYGVFTRIEESHKIMKSNEYFPAVTLCSLSPFKESSQTNFPTYQDFYNLLMKRLEERSLQNKTLNAQQIAYLTHIATYFDWLGRNRAKEIGHEPSVLLLSCKITMAGFESSSIPCKDYSNITIVQSPTMFNCLNIKFYIPYVFNTIIDKVILTLYLGEMPQDFKFYKDRNGVLGGEGIKLLVHDRNEVSPRIQDMGLIIPKGSEAFVITQPILRIRKSTPYTDCVSEKDVTYNYDGDEVDASAIAHCVTKTWQSIAINLFNCTLSEVALVPKLENLNLKRCKYLSPDINMNELNDVILKNDFFYNLTAAIDYKGVPKSILGPEIFCKVRCREKFYRQTLSTIPLEKSLMFNILKMADYKNSVEKFIKQTSGYDLCIKQNYSQTECLAKSTKVSYQNLIQLHIQQDIAKGAIIERDTPQFSIGDFLAKLAAAVNFWCGFSVIVGFEIIDFVLQVCYSLCSDRKKKTPVNNYQLT